VRNNATASPLDTYRTTTVSTGSVEQRLDLTGSAQRVNQVSRSFAVTGAVSSVSVAVGDTVKAGQTLATLDPAPLNSAVTAAKATLAKAKATLESDQSATTSTTSNANGSNSSNNASGSGGTAATPISTPVPTATPTATPHASSTSGRSGAGAKQSLALAQRRVTSAQKAITADLQRASVALARCVPFFPSASSPSGPSPTTSATSSTTTAPTGSSTTSATPTDTTTTATPSTNTATPSDAAITACLGALRTAPTQQRIQRDQRELTSSQSALMTSVTLAITTAGNAANAPGTTSLSATTSQSSTGRSTTSQSASSQSAANQSASSQSAANQSSAGQTGGAGQSSAARVVSDQAAVTNASTSLSGAETDRASAILKSSTAGTVGSVGFVKGTSSNGKTIVIVGAGAVEVTVNVPLASMASVHVGQKANVTPKGATTSVPGAVTSISLLPTAAATGTGTSQATATTSSPTYPVVVLVPDALPALASGSRADVSLLIGTTGDVLTVPNSALTPLGNGQAIAVTLKKGVATRALVKTGYAGTLTTQVTSGLAAGQQVVLADLSTALPTNTTSSRRFGVGAGAGGLGAGGLAGAGLTGGTITGGTGFPRG